MSIKRALSCVVNVLSLFTLGKHRTSFYFRNRQDHTTIIGSVITLVLTIIAGVTSFDIMRGIANRETTTISSVFKRKVPPLDEKDFVAKIKPVF